MFISALILFFLVLIAYSFIESFDRPIMEGLKGKKKNKGGKNASAKIASDAEAVATDENDEEDAPATSAPAPVPAKPATKAEKKAAAKAEKEAAKAEKAEKKAAASQPTMDSSIQKKLDEQGATIASQAKDIAALQQTVKDMSTGLAASQPTTVDVGEEDDTEDV